MPNIFFDFGKIGDYVPPNFSIGLGKLEVVDVGNYPRSYEVAKLLLKQSLGAKLEIISKPAKFLMKLIGQSGDRLSSNPEPD